MLDGNIRDSVDAAERKPALRRGRDRTRGAAAREGNSDPEAVLLDPEIPLLGISIVALIKVRRGTCTKVFIT